MKSGSKLQSDVQSESGGGCGSARYSMVNELKFCRTHECGGE
jgi:hypothetical protein